MRKPYIKKGPTPEQKEKLLLSIVEHGIENNEFRRIYQKIDNVWRVVAIGCMNCDHSYHSLVPAINHISKCEGKKINSLTED